MAVRLILIPLVLISLASQILAQNPASRLGGGVPIGALDPNQPDDDVLPNSHGQVWRQYPIDEYTARINSTNKPEQAIIDWILRETGTEPWFTDPLGILSANRRTVSVYHTPEMQQVVRGVVQRFTQGRSEPYVFSIRLATVNSPGWRGAAMHMMRPVSVQSPGLDAWLVSKENAAVLLANLARRTDYREHNSPHLRIYNGQSHRLARMRPRQYLRSVDVGAPGRQAPDMQMAQVEEGFALEFSPLLSIDEGTVDAVVKCEITQIERFVPVAIDLPAPGGLAPRAEVYVPQMVGRRMHERFRWPTDHVLVLSCGVVPTPGPNRATTLGIPNPFSVAPGRADALLFIESKGPASQALIESARSANGAVSNRGRY